MTSSLRSRDLTLLSNATCAPATKSGRIEKMKTRTTVTVICDERFQ